MNFWNKTEEYEPKRSVIQSVSFIMTPFTAALSHSKPASAETCCDTGLTPGHNKTDIV